MTPPLTPPVTGPAKGPAAAPTALEEPLAPSPYRVVGRRQEAADVVTLHLEPVAGTAGAFAAGQFNMLTAFGVGEVAISVSSRPGAPGPIEHTIRDVGAVTHALCGAPPGAVVGVRGPFGTDWGVDDLLASTPTDVVVVAGGIGLAPLRGAVSQLAAALDGGASAAPGGTGSRGPGVRRVVVLLGGRSPDQLLFAEDRDRWAGQGVEVRTIVDMADAGWDGPVGTVTTLVATEDLDPARTVALVCGPEVMIRFTARAFEGRGVDPGRILVSLERNMQCGVGLCGHCQLGPLLVCRDGPVVPYGGRVARLLVERER